LHELNRSRMDLGHAPVGVTHEHVTVDTVLDGRRLRSGRCAAYARARSLNHVEWRQATWFSLGPAH
jgi:beta-xylosidase